MSSLAGGAGAIAVAFAMLLSIGVSAAGVPGTARARLTEARSAAAQWQKDAVLVSVTALQAAGDGTAPPNVAGWVYTFHSRNAKAWAGFHAAPEGLERVDVPAGFTQPLPGQFVDSDRVMSEVRKHGFKESGATLLTLTPQRDENLKPGVYWCAAGAEDLSAERGMRAYCVDPASGRFVARMAGAPISPSSAAPPAAPEPGKGAAQGGTLAGFDPAHCGGFSAADAAAILGVAANSLTRKVEQVHPSLWTCTFAPAKSGARVAFSIEVAKSAAEAAAQMDRYRKNLGDAYSDLMGMEDEGVWTEVNKTVTYRKKNVTIQVQQPDGKIPQLRVVQALLSKK